MRNCYGLIIIFSLCVSNSFAQLLTAKEIEDDLVHEYSMLKSFDEKHDYDSVDYQDSVFRTKVATYTQQYSFTLNYPFKKLIDSCNIYIATSENGLFRIYSWDTWGGGTERFFNNVFQFRSGANIYTKVFFDSANIDDPLSFYSDIYTLYANAKVYYLAIDNSIYSSKDVSESIKVFYIENNKLNNANLIKTSSGLDNNIGIEYDFFSVADSPERPVRIIKYDPLKKIIYIPVILDNGQVSDKFNRYKFNGKYFLKI